MTRTYEEFINSKKWRHIDAGFDCDDLNHLFPFQEALVRWAIKRGRAAIFADTGLGKTRMQLTWMNQVLKHTGGKGLILAPLAVAYQSVAEAESIGIDVKYIRSDVDDHGIYITNYDMASKFDLSSYSAIVLDESSIIKHSTSKFRNWLIENCQEIPYRLSCTATPSPNDYMELGNQAEFLGIMSMSEMLAMFFIHDSGETSKWRLKGHGKIKFWDWLSTWAAVVRKPSDLGFSDDGYILPGLQFKEHIVETGKLLDGSLFFDTAKTLSERNIARRITIDDRVRKCAELVNANKESSWIVWCHLNDESAKLAAQIEDAVEIVGSDKPDFKEKTMLDFAAGKVRVLVSKPSICGFGMNWQHCNRMAFVGLNDSYEQLYQAIRRCYRFGQQREVEVHIISSDLESATLENIKRKEANAEAMSEQMRQFMGDLTRREVTESMREKTEYNAKTQFILPSFIQ